MLIPFSAQRRGHTQLAWLDSYHSFSFGEFYDPERMGVSVLRVINDDVVHGGGGFGAHPHRDMEIITYMVSGTIEHRTHRQCRCARISAGVTAHWFYPSRTRHCDYR